MEITWYGQSAFRLKTKTATIIIDPFDPKIGLSWPKQSADILLMSHEHADHHYAAGVDAAFIAEGPGEYEVKEVSLAGTRLFHDAQKGAERGPVTAFTIFAEGLSVCHLSDLGHELTAEQTEEVQGADILLIPVGGSYTIDGATAAKVVSQIEPRIVIPMHYQIPSLQIGAQLETVEPFFKALGRPMPDPQPMLKITKESLPEELQVVILEPKKS